MRFEAADLTRDDLRPIVAVNGSRLHKEISFAPMLDLEAGWRVAAGQVVTRQR